MLKIGNWNITFSDVLTIVAIALAVYALVYAIRHHKTLEEVKKWISTQPVGNFPANMDAIINVISGANERIRIMADLVAYGHFSDPDKSREYLRALADKKLKAEITLIVYDSDTSMKARKAQWKPDEFPQYLKRNLRKFELFFERYHPMLGGIPKDHTAFVEALGRDEQARREEIRNQGIDLHLIEGIQSLPFFLWLRDHHEAVFSFYNLDDTVREISFRTTDKALIDALADVFERVKNSAARSMTVSTSD